MIRISLCRRCVSVYIQEKPKRIADSRIPASCAGKTLVGTAVVGTLSQPEVVTKPQPGCPAQHFTVTAALGVAVPRRGVKVTQLRARMLTRSWARTYASAVGVSSAGGAGAWSG